MVGPCQVQVDHVSEGHRESLAEQLGYTKLSTMKMLMAKREVGSGSQERLCLLPPWEVFKPCLEKSPEEPGLVPELILLWEDPTCPFPADTASPSSGELSKQFPNSQEHPCLAERT